MTAVAWRGVVMPMPLVIIMIMVMDVRCPINYIPPTFFSKQYGPRCVVVITVPIVLIFCTGATFLGKSESREKPIIGFLPVVTLLPLPTSSPLFHYLYDFIWNENGNEMEKIELE